ncbi:MAG: hypothetical protein K2X57_03675 [Xanthobacteraceae bacterium]|nr:hypothetical protein [Xanthobacteraceae bacterium]
MNPDERWRHLEEALMSLVDSMAAQLDDMNRKILIDFIENREFGVALEWLHSIIRVRDLQLSDQQETEVQRLAGLMNIDLSKVD